MSDINVLLNRQQSLEVLVLFAGMMLAAALEMIGIASIPAFVALLVDPERLLANVPKWMLDVDVVARGHATLTLAFAGTLAVFFLVKNLVLARLAFLEAHVLREITVANATRLFRTYLFSPYVLHLQRNPAELINNINNVVGDAVEYLHNALVLLREGLVSLVVVVLLLIADPPVSLSVFALLGTTATLFHLAVRRSLAVRGERSQFHHTRQMQVMNEGLGAVKMIGLLGRQSYALNRFRHETVELWRHEFFHRVMTALPRLFLEVVAVSGVLLVVALFVAFDREVNAMLPVLALLVVALVRMMPAFNAIGIAVSGMHYHRNALSVIARELTILREESAIPAVSMPPLGREIELCDVRYRYPGAAVDSLRGVSLRIAAGEAVGIAGPTGAGKSTLVDVLLGLLTPDSGSVRVDGADISVSRQAWQRQVGYVPQDIYLLDDTIRRNVAFGLDDEEIDDEAVASAVEAAQLTDFLRTLPDGLDTTVGNRGIRLSGGQRQRIGIARALYHDPAVLVMDEATSALDTETEAAVIDATARLRGDRTIVIIAHRVSTLSTCDRVLHLRAGRLVEAELS